MKDALGHGSNGTTGIRRQQVSVAPTARFSGRTNLGNTTDTQRHVADLRARLSAPKEGLLHSFARGLKDALAAGAKLHANSLNGYDPRNAR